jgi:hypothetical protein
MAPGNVRRAVLLLWFAACADTPNINESLIFRSAIVQDIARGRTVRFDADGSTHELAGTSWTLVSSTGPAARDFPALAYDAARERVILFGGDCRNDSWSWDGNVWTELQTTEKPPARSAASMIYDPVREVLVLVGGSGCAEESLRDIWEFDGEAWTPRSP